MTSCDCCLLRSKTTWKLHEEEIHIQIPQGLPLQKRLSKGAPVLRRLKGLSEASFKTLDRCSNAMKERTASDLFLYGRKQNSDLVIVVVGRFILYISKQFTWNKLSTLHLHEISEFCTLSSLLHQLRPV